MDTFLGMSATAWTAITAIATLGLVLYASMQLRSAARDSRNRSSPVLVPVLEPGKHNDRVDLVITNFGPSAAFGVSVELSDAIKEHETIPGSTTELFLDYMKRKFGEPFPVWAPGQVERSQFLWGADDTSGQGKSLDGIGLTIAYDGADFRPRRWWRPGRSKREFREEFQLPLHHRMHHLGASSSLDLDQQMKTLIGIRQKSNQQTLRIAQAVETLAEQAAAANQHGIGAERRTPLP
jgi:hypothetical protein